MSVAAFVWLMPFYVAFRSRLWLPLDLVFGVNGGRKWHHNHWSAHA